MGLHTGVYAHFQRIYGCIAGLPRRHVRGSKIRYAIVSAIVMLSWLELGLQ